MLTFGSLFAGIGGLDLGLENAGMTCKWQVEIDEFAVKILEKNYPDVSRYGDVKSVGAHNLESVDVICGGFPCQDISNAGKKAGIEGSRSGLWKEFYRIICELRPRYVLVENVEALRYRGINRVLADLASCGYDAEWQVLPAYAFGLPHRRERIFIVAYPQQRQQDRVYAINPQGRSEQSYRKEAPETLVSVCDLVEKLEQRWGTSSVCGKDDGVPDWLDRLAVLGNAVVPQVAEFVGECIVKHASMNDEHLEEVA